LQNSSMYQQSSLLQTVRHNFLESLHLTLVMTCLDSGWTPIPCFDTCTRIITHLTAWTFVGPPYCRDQALLRLLERYAEVMPTSGFFISNFPTFLKP
jgi:hypothetical protein